MGYLTNSGSGFLKDAVNVASDVKTYLINKGGYLYDTIRIGINDFGQRVLDDGGTIEASAEAAASYREITKDIYDQASLVLFPSGYKDNLLYSHKPVDGSGDFTYTRGIDTATRVGADGYIKKERANFLLQSNQFDTTWAVITSVSEGEEGYDGTTDAWSLTRASGGSLMGYQTVSLSGVSTYSIYAKINTNNGIGLALGGLSIAARFDLRDATKTQAVTETGIISSSQKYVGNGFYRLSITANVSGGTEARIYLTTADAIASDGNGGTHIIQDSQIEQGLVATPYIETTTVPVYEGLTDNLPRIDYTGGSPSILLEPTTTNEAIDSEDFTTANWDATSCEITANDTVSPDGTENATKIVAVDATTDFRLRTVTAGGSNSSNTHSIFVKHIEGGFDYIVLGSTNPQQRYAFDISTGVLVGDIGVNNALAASIEDYGNGWYRCSITVTDSGGGNRFEIYLSDDGTDIVATGDGTKGAYIWGAQREQGSAILTSYVPSSGTAAVRSAETATSTGLINAGDDFTLLVELEPITRETTTEQYISGSGDFGFLDNSGRNTMRYSFNATDYTFSISDLGSHKILFRKDSTDYKIYFNGSLAHTIATLPTGVQDLVLSSGKLGKCLFFSSALTENECEALTT